MSVVFDYMEDFSAIRQAQKSGLFVLVSQWGRSSSVHS